MKPLSLPLVLLWAGLFTLAGTRSGAAAPAVTITSPTTGAVLSAPATFDLRASVAGGGNNVAQIQFLNGTNSLAIDTNNPYRATVTNLAAGTYELWAVLTDTLGGQSSNSVSIIVNELPAVTITAPADGAGLIGPATFLLSANATDLDGSVRQVQFLRGTTAIGLVTNAPYEVTVRKLGAGTYTFNAVATDNLGGTSDTNIQVVVKNRPTVAFTAPAANARITATNLLVTGTAADSHGVTNVEYSLNGGPFLSATGTNVWNVSLTLPPGTNTLRVRSTDRFGNTSLTNTRSCFQVVTGALTLAINGTGTISGATNGQTLEIGRGYQITATPGVGFLFSNWAGHATSSLPTLGFLMQSNMSLQANFVPNPFLRVSGTFNGLFYETNETRSASSGDFKLKVNSSGKYSANVRVAGRRHGMAGRLDLEGHATNNVLRSGLSPLRVVWAVDLHGLDQVTGSVEDGQWASPLLGDRSVFNATTNPAPMAAPYTLIIAGGTNGPSGDGWGTLRVTSSGLGLLSATLADGTRVTRKMPVSKNGDWPLYAPLYLAQGSLLGWLQFDTNAALTDVSGSVDWIRSNQPAALYYPGGFTNQTTLVGSRYRAPGSTNRVLALTNGVVILTGGNLTQTSTNDIILGSNNRVTNAGPFSLTLTIAPTTGLFKGSFLDTGSVRSVTFSGALLQKSTNGSGYVRGTNLSGHVYLGP